MRKPWVQLYAPFIALAMIQALFVAVAPSRGVNSRPQLEALDGGHVMPDTSTPVEAGDPMLGGSAAGSPSGTSQSSSPSGSASGSSGGEQLGLPTGDTSHCTPDGRQFAILLAGGPPCVATFAGDNGGDTYQGVTGDSIKVVFFFTRRNDQADAVLAQQGLAIPHAERVDFLETGIAFIEKHYELYGRSIEPIFVESDCPSTPPDYDLCNAEAQAVARLDPFMVVWFPSTYASVYDIWANSGIVSLGCCHFSNEFFAGRRPYRYDPYMQGSESADVIAEYYCTKLAGQTASHSGSIIHPQIGTRGNVRRRLGIVVPEAEGAVNAARRLADAVSGCDGQEVPVFTYEQDIERATEITQAIVSGLIDAGVTTVTCMCDPIAPAFFTTGMTANAYFPEHLLSGMNFVDQDLVGRLYDRQQMRHTFGLSQLPSATPLPDTDAARMWRDMGRDGAPCGRNGCIFLWPYISLLGTALQMAGPNLSPATFEQGLLTMPPIGGWAATQDPRIVLTRFGENDYTAMSDYREVYWSASQPSPVDGQQGAYVDVNGGRRYELGQLPPGGLDGIPVEPN